MSNEAILPRELSRWQYLPHIRQRSRNEWSASCPNCGEYGHVPSHPGDVPDRFRMWLEPVPRGWCRRCPYFAFADDEQVVQLDPAQILEIEELRQRQQKQEQRRLQAKIEELQRQAYHRGFHDAMEEKQRKIWEDEGISQPLQDWFELGWTPDKPYYFADELYHTPALTIPFFQAEKKVVNIQYKLLQPVDGAGKYRFTHEITPPLYLTQPDKPLTGETCLLVEGAKKAIILYAWLGHKYDHVIGVPSKYMSEWMYDSLDQFDTHFILFDPDSFTDQRKDEPEEQATVWRTARRFGESARVAQLPVKPDDYIVKYGQSADALHRIIQQARRIQA